MTRPYNPRRSGEASYNQWTTVVSGDVPDGASGAPNEEYFAQMVHVTNSTESVDASGNSVDYAGLYQNTIFTNQITLSASSQAQLTSLTDRGYLKLRISSGGSVHIGDSSVLSGTGYLLDDAYPVETLTFDDLSLVYAVGSGTLYTIGGCIS